MVRVDGFLVVFLATSLFMAIGDVHCVVHASSKIADINYGSALTSTSTFDVVHYGARADSSDASPAFLAAWEAACQSTVHATLYVPPGTYVLSSIRFGGPCKSVVDFNLAATLVAAPNALGDSTSKWISFTGLQGLRVAGGVLDGNGTSVWDCKISAANQSDCAQGSATLTISDSNGVVLDGIKSVNSSLFHFVIFRSKNITVQGIMAEAPAKSVNTDGLHIQLSTNIDIYQSNFSTGDDCISIGPGTSNIWIDGIRCGSGHGISIGSLGHQKGLDYESVNNVTVNSTVFTGTTNGLRIKTWANAKPGLVNEVTFMHCSMYSVQNPILIDQKYCPHNIDCPGQESAIKISDIGYISISGSSATPTAVTFNCSRLNPCSGIMLQEVHLTYNKDAQPSRAYCENVQGTTAGLVDPHSCF